MQFRKNWQLIVQWQQLDCVCREDVSRPDQRATAADPGSNLTSLFYSYTAQICTYAECQFNIPKHHKTLNTRERERDRITPLVWRRSISLVRQSMSICSNLFLHRNCFISSIWKRTTQDGISPQTQPALQHWTLDSLLLSQWSRSVTVSGGERLHSPELARLGKQQNQGATELSNTSQLTSAATSPSVDSNYNSWLDKKLNPFQMKCCFTAASLT